MPRDAMSGDRRPHCASPQRRQAGLCSCHDAARATTARRTRFRGARPGERWAMETSASSAVGPVRLADALGWGSSALGAPMTLAPRAFLRAIGVEPDAKAVAWTQFVGVREHLATLNIVANRQRRIGLWSRVAGDTMGLALLSQAWRHKRRDPERLRAAMGVVGAI